MASKNRKKGKREDAAEARPKARLAGFPPTPHHNAMADRLSRDPRVRAGVEAGERFDQAKAAAIKTAEPHRKALDDLIEQTLPPLPPPPPGEPQVRRMVGGPMTEAQAEEFDRQRYEAQAVEAEAFREHGYKIVPATHGRSADLIAEVAALADAGRPPDEPEPPSAQQAATPEAPPRQFDDTITTAVAVRDYSVSARTIRRDVQKGILHNRRPPGAPRNATFLLCRVEVAARYPRKK